MEQNENTTNARQPENGAAEPSYSELVAVRREKLLHRLGLPQHMNSKAMLAMLNALHTPDEVAQMVEELEQSQE